MNYETSVLLNLIAAESVKPYLDREVVNILAFFNLHRNAIEMDLTPEIITLVKKVFGPVRASQLRFTFKRKLKPHNPHWSMEEHLEQKTIINEKLRNNARTRAKVRRVRRESSAAA